jgi:hypothetical protein
MSQSFKVADVAKHNKGDDLYIIVDEDVYDLTSFQDERKCPSRQRDLPLSSPFVTWLTILFQTLAARRVRAATLKHITCPANQTQFFKESPERMLQSNFGSKSAALHSDTWTALTAFIGTTMRAF